MGTPVSRDTVSGRIWQQLAVCAVTLTVLISLFPLYWAVVISLKPRDVPATDVWLPGVTFTPSVDAWRGLFAVPDLGSSFWNSIHISAGSASLAVVLAAPACHWHRFQQAAGRTAPSPVWQYRASPDRICCYHRGVARDWRTG